MTVGTMPYGEVGQTANPESVAPLSTTADAGAMRDCQFVVRLAEWGASGVGAVVLAGWLGGVEVFKTLLVPGPAMSPTTAVCFLLAGLALGRLHSSAPDRTITATRRALGQLLALSVVLVGVAILLEYLFGVEAGQDPLGWPAALIGGHAPDPGRMAAVTSVGMTLIGSALLLLESRSQVANRIRQVLAIAVMLIGLMVVKGFLYGLDVVHHFPPFAGIALPTALTLVVFGTGLLFVRPDQGLMAIFTSRFDGGLMSRRVLPILVLAPLLLGWVRLVGEERGWYGTELGFVLFGSAYTLLVTVILWIGARGLNGLDASRRTSDARLADERGRWRMVVQGIADEVWISDLDGRTSRVTSQAERGGQSHSGGVTPSDWVPPGVVVETPDGLPCSAGDSPLQRALEGEVVRGEEIRREPGTGTTRWRQYSAAPVRDEGGSVIGAVAVTRDVTREREAERALRDANTFGRQILDSAREGIIVLDRELRYSGWNTFMEDFSGVRFSDVRGRHPWEVFPMLVDLGVNRGLERALQGESLTLPDHELVWPNRAEKVAISTSMMPLRNAGGEIIGVLVILRDVTDRLRATAALKVSEQRFLAFMEASPLMACIKDAEGRYVYVNRAWEEGTAQLGGVALGATVNQVMVRHLADRIARLDAIVLESGQPTEVTGQFGSEHGVERWWHMLKFPISGVSGERLVGCFVQDVTGRRSIEEALRESNDRFRELAESISEVFWLSNPSKGEILYVSPAYETIWGRSAERLYQSPHDWLDAIHPEDRDRVTEAASTLQASGAYDEQYRIIRPDGSIRWIRDKAFPVIDGTGKVTRIAGVAEDVTEQRELETQFRQTQKMESIGLLAGGVAHDFNNWLTVIFGCTELLMEPGATAVAEAQELNQEIRHAAEQAASLTRQLLAFSRQQVMDPRILGLNALVSDTEKMLRRLIGEDVLLTTRLDPSVSQIKVDPGHLAQVLMNVAVNARDAMPTGGHLTIETSECGWGEEFIRAHPEARHGRRVILAITDTGCGMTPEVRARLFEPFFTTKGISRGTGLGMAVVHGIVTQSGGDIEVDSAPGQGTTIRISLPALDATSPGEGARIGALGRGGSETVLVVEDESSVRQVAVRVLKRAGYTVLETGDGREALTMLARDECKVDILVTDVVMPEMDGRQLAESVCQRHPGIKVLYTSGYTDDAVVRHGISQSDVAFLQKPYVPRELLRRVREVLDRE